MNVFSRKLSILLLPFAAVLGVIAGCNNGNVSAGGGVPADIQAIFNKPVYQGATWALRVVNADSGKVLINLKPDDNLYIGSVRKAFTVGELLNEIGPDHRYDTPVYRQGDVDNAGVLHGDLIIQASGDLTMGGRTNPDGSIAISSYDHNEANTLGNAVLTAPDPLAGYKSLAAQVAAAGIKEVDGDVVIDDRLFQPFNFRNEFDVRPIFVNDDVVDLTINPTTAGQPASVVWRPVSAALNVDSTLITSGAGTDYTLELAPEFPQCIGSPGCTAGITGELPTDDVPPLTGKFPLVQTFRITEPSNYGRTVFIEALEAAGVTVNAPAVEVNPVQLLPPKDSYPAGTKVAELIGLPYSDYAKFILKVSYNIGADTDLVLYGLTQGVDNMNDALEAERTNLAANYGIPATEYHFVNGSGGGDTTAVTRAVTQLFSDMQDTPSFPIFEDALPSLGVDGSLAFVKDFQSDPSLAGATGQVHAKTGTYVILSDNPGKLLVKGRGLGGYIHTKSGKTLVYILVVNNVEITSIDDLLRIMQNEGTISAMLWRDN